MPIILDKLEQGSQEWLKARLKCITMSNAGILLMKGKAKGTKSETRENYLMKIASEIITGVPAETYKSWDMARGNALEPFARAAFEKIKNVKVKEVGFGYLNSDKAIGASPDGLFNYDHIYGLYRDGLEIKCPQPKEHMLALATTKLKKQYMLQMQGNMWVFGSNVWHYMSFCPEFSQPVEIRAIERDEKLISQIQEQSFLAVKEVAEIVKNISINTNSEVAQICESAIEILDLINNREPEVY